MKRYPITPVPAPRLNRQSRWNPDKRRIVERYDAFRLEVKLRKIEIPERCYLRFEIPAPKSKRHLIGYPHRQTPDLDNLIKGLLDAALKDDAHIHEIHAEKIWALEGAILVAQLPASHQDAGPDDHR